MIIAAEPGAAAAMSDRLERLFEERNRLLREQNDLLRRSNTIKAAPRPKKPWVCGSWPYCYHGRIVGALFGCADAR